MLVSLSVDSDQYSYSFFLFCPNRFPGGECYSDLIHRVQSVVIDLEQQVCPCVVVSHVSVLQALVAYFRGSPVEKCMSIEIPIHTVIKFTPVRGGGWIESQEQLVPDDDEEDLGGSAMEMAAPGLSLSAPSSPDSPATTPIWGDHMRKVPSTPTMGGV